MFQPTLAYQALLAQELDKILSSTALSLDDAGFVDFHLTAGRQALSGPPDNLERAERLFYLLMGIGRRRPGLFPTPDVCLAMFNLLSARHSLKDARLNCLDLALLPVAVLASGQGAKVAPPPKTTSLSTWPGRLWPVLSREPSDWPETLILGNNPVKLTREHPNIPEKLAQAKGGLFFCLWDFLGVNLHSQIRRNWLDAGIIRAVLQLPRPRRQRVVYYPALIEIGPAKDPAQIRLAEITGQDPGPGGLDQAEVLRALLGPAEEKLSRDVSKKDLIQNGRVDLTPRRCLEDQGGPAKKSIPDGDREEKLISDGAQIIRNQTPRLRPSSKEPASGAGERGYLCREITLANLDERTGFLKPKAGQEVELMSGDPWSRANQQLQRHDILLCYRGTEATIGRLGLVELQPDGPLICGQSLCLIRTSPRILDPVWLYYHLRREETRKKILSRSSGSSMLTVNLGDLREMRIAYPEPGRVQLCRERHERIVRLANQIDELYDQAEAELKELMNSMARASAPA